MSTKAESTITNQIAFLKSYGMCSKEYDDHVGLPRASVLVPLFSTKPTTNNNNNKNSSSTTTIHHKDVNVADACASCESLHVLLTQRPLHLKSHPGEVCLPGGKQDPKDNHNDMETALRETWEEVGLDRTRINVLCRLPTVESQGGLCVTPFVSIVNMMEKGDDDANSKDTPEEVNDVTSVLNRLHQMRQVPNDEVEAVFAVPIEFFLERSGNLVDKIQVPWSGGDGDHIGVFTLRTYFYSCDHPRGPVQTTRFKIFGLTAHVLHQVACLAFFGRGTEESNSHHDQCNSAVLAHQPTITTTSTFKGSLWVWRSDKFWSEQYGVLESGMLHLYASEVAANRKSSTAVKKNRLPMSDVKVMKIDYDQEGKFAFLVSVLNGTIEWKLAAGSAQLRDQWMKAATASSC